MLCQILYLGASQRLPDITPRLILMYKSWVGMNHVSVVQEKNIKSATVNLLESMQLHYL